MGVNRRLLIWQANNSTNVIPDLIWPMGGKMRGNFAPQKLRTKSASRDHEPFNFFKSSITSAELREVLADK